MTRQDHYATLGVARDASTEEVVRAHRRAASHAHPDKGGTTERMQALNVAKDVLSDPERRARYDAGDEGTSVDPDEKARTLLCQLFAGAIAANADDPVDGSRQALRKGIADADSKIVTNRAAIRKLNAQLNRVIAKTGRNMFKELLDAAIDEAEASIRKLEATRGTAERALEILAREYEPGPGARRDAPSTYYYDDDVLYSLGRGPDLASFRRSWNKGS